MTRALIAALLLVATGEPAGAKILCPPGDFVVRAVGGAPSPLGDGVVLALGAGRAALDGVCPKARAGQFHRASGTWLGRVRARWTVCTRVADVRLRARFTMDAPYCTRLTGTLRMSGRRFEVVADRVPACGNGLREPGEQCDGTDSAHFGACCTADCTVAPGCPVQCDARFPCGAQEICLTTCGFVGTCHPLSAVTCGGGPVCACDHVTTYPDSCAAYAAGTGVFRTGACTPP